MKLFGAVTEVPLVVVTTISLAPAVPACATALISVALATRLVASIPSMVTLMAPAKFVPVILNATPPASGADTGLITAMVGSDVS